jgi:hypothetical protein
MFQKKATVGYGKAQQLGEDMGVSPGEVVGSMLIA